MFVTVLLFENEFDALDGILKWNNKEIKNIEWREMRGGNAMDYKNIFF